MKEETAWLIELVSKNGNTTHYLWAETTTGEYIDNGMFRWEPTVRGALRFSRKRDALNFIWAVRHLQLSLPYRDVFHGLVSGDERIRVAEHAWIDGMTVDTVKAR